MARLAVDGTKSIYFEDLGGAGRALIMVHGWGMDNRCWDGVILPLLAAGHRVITMDHRGCGRSDHDFADVSIAANAADIAQLVDHLGLNEVAMCFVTNQDGCCKAFKPIQSEHGILQQTMIIQQREQLFWITLARHWPEPGSSATAENNGLDKHSDSPQVFNQYTVQPDVIISLRSRGRRLLSRQPKAVGNNAHLRCSRQFDLGLQSALRVPRQ